MADVAKGQLLCRPGGSSTTSFGLLGTVSHCSMPTIMSDYLSIRSFQPVLNVIVHAVGVMPEHVHLACSIPPTIAVSEFVRRIKGASSRRLNQTIFASDANDFGWQAEYGAFSFADRSLPDVITYVRNQPEHHATGRLWPGYEAIRDRAEST